MVRLSVTENGAGLAFQDSGLTFMVGMIAASISMMAIVIFACAKSSAKRKNKNETCNRGDGGDTGGNKTSAKTIIIGESKTQNTRATSAPVHSVGEILVSAATTSAAIVDIPSTDDGRNDNHNGGKDTQCHGSNTTKSNGDDYGNKNNNDVCGSSDSHAIINSNHGRTDDNYVSGDTNNNVGGGHTHTSTDTTSGGGGYHHDYTSGNTGGGGGGWSSDHGGSSWSGGDHGGGGFSSGGDTGGFSGGGW